MRLAFDADDGAAGAYPLGEQVQDAQRTAADVDGAGARLETDLIQQPVRLRREACRLLAQAFPLDRIGPQHIRVRVLHQPPPPASSPRMHRSYLAWWDHLVSSSPDGPMNLSLRQKQMR